MDTKRKEKRNNQATERRLRVEQVQIKKDRTEEEASLKSKVKKNKERGRRGRKAEAVDFNQMQSSHSERQPTGMYSCFSYVMGRLLYPNNPPPPFLLTSLSLASSTLNPLVSFMSAACDSFTYCINRHLTKGRTWIVSVYCRDKCWSRNSSSLGNK